VARVYAVFGTTLLSAADSFDAVAGSNRALTIGAGGTVTVWKGLFVDGAFSQIAVDGERVFVNEGTVFPLGIPLEIRMRPLDVGAGWRWTAGRLSPYAGGGFTWMSYTETSDFADTGEDLDESQTGWLLLGGVDVQLSRWVHIGGDVRYRSVNGVLGAGGVSEIYGEGNLGGFGALARVSIGR
jgi:opacity protein-like surface antigen